MKLSFSRQGYLDGTPWIARLSSPVVVCKVSSHLRGQNIQSEAKVLFANDLGYDIENAEDTNVAVLRALGGSEITSPDGNPQEVVILVWASSLEKRNPENGDDSNDVEEGSSIMIDVSIWLDDSSEPKKIEALFIKSKFDVDANQLLFGDCLERTAPVREFTIRNLCDSKVLYHIEVFHDDGGGGAEDKELVLSFYDTGVAIKPGVTYELPGKGFARVNATVRSARAGQHNWTISVENERNFKNNAEISVKANVLQPDGANSTSSGSSTQAIPLEISEPGHRVLSNFQCNFGECYVGNVVSKRLILRNVGTSELEVTLSCPDAHIVGQASMQDASSVQLGLFNFSSDSENEDDRRSPYHHHSVADHESLALPPRSLDVDVNRSEEDVTLGGGNGAAGGIGEVLAEEPRTRSDTTGSAGYRNSLNSLTSPSINLMKRSEAADFVAVRESSFRDRHDSWSPMSRPSLSFVGRQLPVGEVVHLGPGQEKEVFVLYVPIIPSSTSTSSSSGGGQPSTTLPPLSERWRKFFKHAFKLDFSYGPPTKPRQHRFVNAEVKACVSFVSVSPALIRFGDCLVNQKKTAVLTFKNHSDIEGTMKLSLQSKALKVDHETFNIEPHGQFQVLLTFIPRSINPNYSKDIRCINVKSKESNTSVVTVQSSNVDLHNFAYHAFFYRLVAYENGQEVDFTNWPTFFSPTLLDGLNVRRLGIHNLTNRELKLQFKYPEELQILSFASDVSFKDELEKTVSAFETASFAKHSRKIDNSSAMGTSDEKRDDVVEAAERRLTAFAAVDSLASLRKLNSITLPPDGYEVVAVVFRPTSVKRPLVGGHLVFEGSLSVDIEMLNVDLQDVQALQDAVRWTFSDKDDSQHGPDSADASAMNYLKATLSGLETTAVDTPLVLSPTMSAANSSRDQALEGEMQQQQQQQPLVTTLPPAISLDTSFKSKLAIPLLRVPLRATVARSSMKLSQTHFHFGVVDNAWERRSASFSLFNLCAIPLLYRIERRLATQQNPPTPTCVDLVEDSFTGVVPPFGNESRSLLLVPRIWRGPIKESLMIRNVLDGRGLEIVVKADVMIPEHFRVENENEELDFGPCYPGTTSTSARFISLINTTKKTRDLVVQVNLSHGKDWPKGHVPVFCFHLFPPQTGSNSEDSVSLLEQCEVLEQQIRVATRKSDSERLLMLNRKLNTLQQSLSKASPLLPGNTSASGGGRIPRLSPIGPLKGSVLVSIPPHSMVKVAVWLHVRLMNQSAAFNGSAKHVGFRIFESKQGDQVVKKVKFACELFANRGAYLKAIGSSPAAGIFTSPRLLGASHLGSPSTDRPSGPGKVAFNRMELDEESPQKSHVATTAATTTVSEYNVVTDNSNSLFLQTAPKKVRQIEVGTQGINEWFSFFIEISCSGVAQPPSTPRSGNNSGAQSGQMSPTSSNMFSNSERDGVDPSVTHSFRFLRVYLSDDTKRVSEVKLPTDEINLTQAEGRKQIKLEAQFRKGGRHVISLIVFRKNRSTDEEEREEILIKGQASFLELLPWSLDFGNVIVVPDVKAEREQPFTLAAPICEAKISVKNTHSDSVLVTAESNSNQVVVFSSDSEQIDRVLLEPNQILPITVSVKPSLLADAWLGACRLLKGGVVVTCEVGSEDDRDLTHVAKFQSTVPFSGVVGMSVFSIVEQKAPGIIRILNKSEKIPLLIEASSDSEDVVFSPKASPLEIPAASGMDVTVRVEGKSTALQFRDVRFRSIPSGEVQCVRKAACALSSNEFLRIERGFGVGVAVPVIKKDDSFLVAHDAVSIEPIRIRNVSKKPLLVIMRCGMMMGDAQQDELCEPPTLLVDTQADRVTHDFPLPVGYARSAGGLVPRAQCYLRPEKEFDVLFKYPKDNKLSQGSFRGWITFETKPDGEGCATAARFQGEARVSSFDIDKKKIDAGEVGLLNQWSLSMFELIRLSNADRFIPAEVSVLVTSPKGYLKIEPVKNTYHVSPASLEIIMGTLTVSAREFLMDESTSAAGNDFELTLKLTNALNDVNLYIVPIKVRVLPKRFFIEKEQEIIDSLLCLPTVEYPQFTPTPPTPASSPPAAAVPGGVPASGGAGGVSSGGATSTIGGAGLSGVGSKDDTAAAAAAATVSVNEWITIVNPSNMMECTLDTSCTTSAQHLGEVTLLMVFRSTGAPVPQTLRLKPAERVNVRIVLRCEKGCSLRGEIEEFGIVRFASSGLSTGGGTGNAPSEDNSVSLRITGKIAGGPLIRSIPERKLDLRVSQIVRPSLFNDTKLPLTVSFVTSDPTIVSFHASLDYEGHLQHGILTGNQGENAADLGNRFEIPPFGSVNFPLMARKPGQAKIKFECDQPYRASGGLIELDVFVEPAPSSLSPAFQFSSANSVTEGGRGGSGGEDVVPERTLTPVPSPPTSKKPHSATTGVYVTGCTSFISDPGLYEIDAGILAESKTWNLSGLPGDCILVGAELRGTSEVAWATMKRTGLDTVQLKLTPQNAGDTGGFFAAYLLSQRCALVRVKMEVVMRESDDIVLNSPPMLTNLATSSSVSSDSLPFEVSPKSIVSGPLYFGRQRSFPFLLFNRHQTSSLVFQLNAIGVKGGMQAWFSIAGVQEEHRRVTILSNSSVRLALNIIVPNEQSEDFTDLEVTIACRHLRNSRITLIVQLPKRAQSPQFAISDTTAKAGDAIRIQSCGDRGLPGDFVVVVGPEWIKCSVVPSESTNRTESHDGESLSSQSSVARKSTFSSGLVRARLNLGEAFKIDSADAPGILTVYSADDAFNHLSIRVHLGNACVVPPGGANLWRDAIELELAKACVFGEFVCPPDIVFREILELLERDPGGRGSSLVTVYFRLRFGLGLADNDQLRVIRELFVEELKSLPESLLVNLSDL